jgi:EpsD family peptidyl-prolyl cis-trans isomerase
MRQRIVFTLLLAVMATACQKKATGQTVAIVNNEEITAAELNAELSNETSNAGIDPKIARAAALEKLIDRKLLVQQAKSDGLDKSPEYVNQQRQATENLLINMLVTRHTNTAQVPSPDEISRFEASRPEVFSNRQIWTLQQILYPLPKDQALTAKLAAAQTLDEVASLLTASGIQFTRGSKQLDTAVFPHQIYQQIANLKDGEPFIAPGADKAVASVVTARQPAPLNPDQTRQVALSLMRRDQVQKFVEDRVKGLKTSAKIEYQPGFAPPKK